MKKKIISLACVAVFALSFGLTACDRSNDADKNNNNGTVTGTETQWYTDYAKVDSENYNKNLYFLNELKFEIADPSVIYIDHGEEEGYFYAYGTSDLVGCFGIQCWRSKDLTNWEYKSVAYQPDFENTWAYTNHWAPEVIYDSASEMYLLFYNADWFEKDNMKCISVAYSENPYGPFVPMASPTEPLYDFSVNNSAISRDLQRKDVIDAHPFIDPVTGDKYLYYSGYGIDGNGNRHGQTIFGVKMIDWATPDYSTLKELTKLYNTTTDRNDNDIDEGSPDTVNEGPFVWYQDGTYYLTFSVYAYTRAAYQVRQAISTSPLGDYTKIQPRDGGQVIATDSAWGTITSAGHHCFIACGDTLMIAYHTFLNRNDITEGRALAVDTVSFVKNDKGQTLMHANGPTYSYQPLPEEISGYKNLAPQATVTASNMADDSDIDYLTDGVLKVHESDPVKEFTTSGGNTVITLSYNKFVNVRSIMIYNSIQYDNAFWGINSIKLNVKTGDNSTAELEMKNVTFDYKWHSDSVRMIYPGANSIVEFNELPVNKITITINGTASDIRSLNEIVVLGKEVSNASPVSALSDYSYTEPAPVSPLPVYESLTFGSSNDGMFLSDYGYDLSHDDGTEDAYVDKVWCGNQQILYFKDVFSTSFYVEAEMSVLDHTTSYIGDEYPKIGIVMKSANNYFVYYNINCLATYDNNVVGYVESNMAGSDYMWDDYESQSYPIENLNYTGDSYVKLGVARIGETMYLFANDNLVCTIDGTLRGFTNNKDTAAAVGFLSYNTFTRIKNYSITDSEAEISAKLASLGVSLG